MQFIIKLNKFKKEIKRITSISQKNSLFQQNYDLIGLWIEANNGKIILESKNEFLDIKIELVNDVDIFFKIENEGSVYVKGRILSEILNKTNGEDIFIKKIDESSLIIKTKDSEYDLNLFDKNNFEKNNFELIEGIHFKTTFKTFKSSFDKVSFSCSEKQSRRILQGINFKVIDNNLITLATDGIRIAMTSMYIENSTFFNKTIHIKVFRELIKVIEEEEIIKIIFGDSKALILSKTFSIKINLIEGQFPEVEKAFPQSFENTLKIKKEELLNVLEKITILSQSRNPENVMIKLNINDDLLSFETRELEIGYANANTKSFLWNGRQIYNVSFRPKYLLDTLKVIDEPSIILSFNEQETPFQITGENNTNLKFLVLPLSIS